MCKSQSSNKKLCASQLRFYNSINNLSIEGGLLCVRI
jgi:hypothetical protein